jgi:hypothetical protein
MLSICRKSVHLAVKLVWWVRGYLEDLSAISELDVNSDAPGKKVTNMFKHLNKLAYLCICMSGTVCVCIASSGIMKALPFVRVAVGCRSVAKCLCIQCNAHLAKHEYTNAHIHTNLCMHTLQANLTRLALEVEDIVLLGSAPTRSSNSSTGRSSQSVDGSGHSQNSTTSSTSSSSAISNSKGVMYSLIAPTPVQSALIIEQLGMLQHRRKDVAR